MDIRAYRVEDLGIPPHRLESIVCNTTGPTCVETTKSSASFEMAGVSEMGLRCLMRSSTGFCLGRGTKSASFHEVGSLCSLKLAFNMKVMGCTRISAYFLRSQFLMPSGPAALRAFSFVRADRTAGSVMLCAAESFSLVLIACSGS